MPLSVLQIFITCPENVVKLDNLFKGFTEDCVHETVSISFNARFLMMKLSQKWGSFFSSNNVQKNLFSRFDVGTGTSCSCRYVCPYFEHIFHVSMTKIYWLILRSQYQLHMKIVAYIEKCSMFRYSALTTWEIPMIQWCSSLNRWIRGMSQRDRAQTKKIKHDDRQLLELCDINLTSSINLALLYWKGQIFELNFDHWAKVHNRKESSLIQAHIFGQ